MKLPPERKAVRAKYRHHPAEKSFEFASDDLECSIPQRFENIVRQYPDKLAVKIAERTLTYSFQVWEGGGEYNVARGLKRCFGLRTAVVTAFVDNPVGRLLQDLLYQGGVAPTYVRFVPDDGVGRTVRNGLNFTERGFGVRAALGCSDRGHTAVSQQ